MVMELNHYWNSVLWNNNWLCIESKEYFKSFGLNQKRLKIAKDNALVLHPGPINRGVEIESEVADGKQSVILNQVKYGIAIRMAVMAMMVGKK